MQSGFKSHKLSITKMFCFFRSRARQLKPVCLLFVKKGRIGSDNKLSKNRIGATVIFCVKVWPKNEVMKKNWCTPG